MMRALCQATRVVMLSLPGWIMSTVLARLPYMRYIIFWIFPVFYWLPAPCIPLYGRVY